MALQINPRAEGTALTLELNGKISILETAELDKAIAEQAKGIKQVLLDFSQVEYISSAGLRSLFMAKKNLMRQGAELKILYPTEDVMSVFRTTHFDSLLTIVQRENEGEETAFYPLRPVQRWMVDTHFLMARSTMMNTGALIELDPSIDLERLAGAANGVLANHDVFRCRLVIHPETGDICQRFDGELEKARVEIMSDEAFVQRKQEVKQPYELINHPLYRLYIMQTATGKYLYVDFYHAIMDGTAIAMLFWRELTKRYHDAGQQDAAKTKYHSSSYAAYIREESQIPPDELEEGHTYWRKMLSDFDEEKHLPPADLDGESLTPEHEIEVPFPEFEKTFFRGKDFSENTFFLGASLLALAKATGRKEAILGWIHNGRINSSERRLMGLMLDQFPARWDFTEPITAGDFLRQLEAQVKEGMKYRKSLDLIYEEALGDGCASFILQKGTMGRRGEMSLDGKDCFIVEMPANEISAAENSLDIEMNSHDDGTYSLVLDYDNHRYSEKAMQNFAAVMESMVKALMDESCEVTSLLQ
ncbi:MAG: STAS domain-containing protein [Acidaminococcaceae bacterium]|nr:STAS domain-containing protein [Acidaminococcaceae bacterium]